ncbi:MAG: tRNA (5-methylaminomethyl-2-thiouridylate)-methyltransferase [Thaumarchaeota archaeon]|nr:tRNA (5-methylaminomethyl-2-thiouridylate)-methyltransferase [Nitrososphaerota archaeon]|tara:strand:- start:1575 stop:2591 length:1017 start_codon:yes stop_codon:yes gene_type:complete
MEEKNKEKPKAVALLSGGLDSTLAVKLMKEQNIDVKAIAIKTPFCDFDCGHGCGFKVKEVAEKLDVELKTFYLGDEYLEMLKNPKHGYGSGMNPCIDCREMMFNVAKDYMQEIDAKFIITGEVLEQRPMSQNPRALKIIEQESGLEGKVLRPLSAKHLKETEAEKTGLVKREQLLNIKGRTRKNQIELAKNLGITDYPNAAGGCLLTDPQFARKAKDLFKHIEKPTLNDTELLKVGRHFRMNNKSKLIVGRNKEENDVISSLALPDGLLLEVKDYTGPVALLYGNYDENVIQLASSIVHRYSDAPNDEECVVITNNNNNLKEIFASLITDEQLNSYRI